jgi:hypothetical protein
LAFSKHGNGTVAFAVNPSGTVEWDSAGAPSNLSVTRISGNTFTVESLNNARGNFTLAFNTPCGSQNVSVTVTN